MDEIQMWESKQFHNDLLSNDPIAGLSLGNEEISFSEQFVIMLNIL